jgi:hypothetical protein
VWKCTGVAFPELQYYAGHDQSVPGVMHCELVSEEDLKAMSWLDLRALGILKLLIP